MLYQVCILFEIPWWEGVRGKGRGGVPTLIFFFLHVSLKFFDFQTEFKSLLNFLKFRKKKKKSAKMIQINYFANTP